MRAWAVLLMILGQACAVAPPTLGFNFAVALQKNPLPVATAAAVVQKTGVRQLKLFDYNVTTLSVLQAAYTSSQNLQITVAVPNNEIALLANGTAHAASVASILKPFASILAFVAVGNEPLAPWYGGQYSANLGAAVSNMQSALASAGLSINVTVPFQMGILFTSYPPKAGAFQPAYIPIITPVLQSLANTNSSFMINIYPYFAWRDGNGAISLDYATGKSGITVDGNTYDSLFDAQYTAVRAAVDSLNFTSVPIVVGETGWPTAGHAGATVDNAKAYVNNLIKGVASSSRSVFIFEAFDEMRKDTTGANPTENHWGVYYENGSPKYEVAAFAPEVVTSHGSRFGTKGFFVLCALTVFAMW